MRGNLERFPLSDVLQILAELEKSGKLKLSRSDEEAVIIFQGGRVIGAASNAVRETLGSLLIGQGLVKAEQLETGLEVQRQAASHPPLGNVLVELGHLSAEDLEQVVNRQTRRVVQDLLHWRHGLYEFVPLDVEDRGEIRSEVAELLLTEGLSPDGLLVDRSGEGRADTFPGRTEDEGPDAEAHRGGADGAKDVAGVLAGGEGAWETADRWVAEDEWPGASPLQVEPGRDVMAPDASSSDAGRPPEGSVVLTGSGASEFASTERGPARGGDPLEWIGRLERTVRPTSPRSVEPDAKVERTEQADHGDEAGRARASEIAETVLIGDAARPPDATVPLGHSADASPDERESGEEAAPSTTFVTFSEPADAADEESSVVDATIEREAHEGSSSGEAVSLGSSGSPGAAADRDDELASLRDVMLEIRGFELTGELMNKVMEYANGRFTRAILFSVQGEQFRSISSFGSGVPEWASRPIDELRIPVDQPSILADTRASRRAFKGRLSDSEANRRIVEFLGGESPEEAVAAPIIAEQRVVLVLYGDNAYDRRPIGSITALEMLLVQIGLRMERNLLEKVNASGPPRPVKAGPELPAEDLRSLVDDDPEPTLVVGAAGKVVYANFSMARTVGSTTIELVGSDLRELVHKEDAKVLEAILHGVGAGDAPAGASVRLRCPNGRFRDFYVALGSSADPSASRVALLRPTAGSGQRAAHDPLTGRLSRDGLAERLNQVMEKAQGKGDALFAVLLVDIDRFKRINEALGWAAGNQLLGAVGDRLIEHLRPDDAVARLGGNQFAILLDRIRGERDVDMVSERLVEVLSRPFTVADEEIFISVSIGGARCHAYCDDVDEIIGLAEKAMHEAKQERGSSIHLVPHESGGRLRAAERIRLESELRQAIEDGEFLPYFQPILSLETGRIEAFELLARWRHPQRGLLEPARFIPVAEQTGLIVPMAKALLRNGCDLLRRWEKLLEGDAPLALGMNFTAAHLERSEVMNTVRALLERRGIEGRQLVVEITESMMIRRRDKVLQILTVLKELGVRVSLDDFGLEYSSLSYLHELPVDSIKLDRSFITNLAAGSAAEAMMRGIVDLAHGLGKSVVAEGIETPEQFAKVRELGADLAQGFLFARPQDAHEAEAWLTGEPPWRALFEGEGASGGEEDVDSESPEGDGVGLSQAG